VHERGLGDEHRAGVRKLAEGIENAREERRLVEVVGIEEGDVLAPGLPDPAVARGGEAPVLLADVTDPVPVRRQRPDRVVGRPVVHDDDLEARVALREHAVDRLGDQIRAVVGGNDHAESRLDVGAWFRRYHGVPVHEPAWLRAR